MTSRRIDQLLAFIGAVLISLSAYQLFFSRSGSYAGSSLGHVSSLEKVVKIKRARSLDWVDAHPLDLVTENQMIYTDDLSRAEVRFTEGQKLIIGENSLVKIRSRGKENELDVNKGFIRATLEGNDPLIVKLNGENYELRGEGADVEINLQGDTGVIGVLSGEVVLEREGKSTALDKTTALIIEGEKYTTRTVAYQLQSPGHQKTFYAMGDSENFPVTFSWEGENEAEIVIALAADFQDARREVLRSSPAVMSLKPGRYFWKLVGKTGQSLTHSFRIVPEISPEILRPRSGDKVQVLESESGERPLRLEWNSPEAKAFLVEVDGSVQETEKESFQFTVRHSEVNWRVKIKDQERPFAQWTPMQKVNVEVMVYPKVPQSLYPDDVEFQTFSKKPDNVELSWASTFPVELEFRGGNETRSLLLKENSYVFNPKDSGPYEWRVRSKDELGRYSTWTEWKKFRIVDLSGEKSPEGIQRIRLNRPDQEVTFGWEGKGTTVFELARDRNFKELILTKEVKGSETKIVVPKTGTYFWRSRDYRKDGTLHVSEPRRVIIEPVPAPAKPEALPPMEVPLERETNTSQMWDFFLSPAYADDVFGVARIALPEKENVKEYVLRIYRKGEGRPLVEERLPGRNFVWKRALPGEYDFEYAVVDYFNRQSPFSDRSPLTILETAGPARPLLISPIRLEKVSLPELKFLWGQADRAKIYRISLYRDDKLKEKILEENLSSPGFHFEGKLDSGTYFWQVVAIDDSGNSTPSSVGRFVYEVPKEEIIAVPDIAPDWWNNRRDRAWMGWAPSSDTYEFSASDQSGEIDGNALMGLEARGTFFREKWIFTGDFLRQSGKVFKKEEYSFMKLTTDAGWILYQGKHLLALGPALGFSMGQAYGIDNSEVTSSGVSGALYGVTIRSFHAFTPDWSGEGKLGYLLGGVKEFEASGVALRKVKSLLLILGLGFSQRDYDKSEGKQNSFRLSVGVGREF